MRATISSINGETVVIKESASYSDLNLINDTLLAAGFVLGKLEWAGKFSFKAPFSDESGRVITLEYS